jgi:hypothetical protein
MNVNRMRLLMIAFAGTDQGGVHRKLGEQVREIRRVVPDTKSLVFVDTRVAPAPVNVPYDVIDLVGGGFDPVSRARAFQLCREAVAEYQPDVVYMRYPLYDAYVEEFVRTSPPVVFEIQTKFDLEMQPEAGALERAWAQRILPLTAGVVAVTPEILAYEQDRAGWNIPGHVMSNGADPNAIPFAMPALAADRVDVLCVASFYVWHGIDRVICGMAAEADVHNLHLHLVGDGPALAPLLSLARDLGVAGRVHSAGLRSFNELTSSFERAHLALGVLAPQRKGLAELSALKHREYALRGVPFVAAGQDIDFAGNLPWLRTVTADDSPICPRMLRAFAMSWTHEKRRRQIRAWGEANVSWAAKIPPLLEFLSARQRSVPLVGAA